jgi:hypothetical protein
VSRSICRGPSARPGQSWRRRPRQGPGGEGLGARDLRQHRSPDAGLDPGEPPRQRRRVRPRRRRAVVGGGPARTAPSR